MDYILPIEPSNGLSYFRRPAGSRLNKKFITPTVKHGYGFIIIRDCVSGFHGSPLHPLKGRVVPFMYESAAGREVSNMLAIRIINPSLSQTGCGIIASMFHNL
ncbi:hypothetical protein ABEB36_011948 [Hypothenemus hampei]|uniref:Uncharacterized protein n=1 Tax=Hypothenemus hampei TaxID=57062 RepID=A0ABD1E9P2_HYPHA